MHDVLPAALPPVAQATQVAASVEPTAVEEVPAAYRVHTPALSWVPAGQSAQPLASTAPVVVMDVPAGQVCRSSNLSEKAPEMADCFGTYACAADAK